MRASRTAQATVPMTRRQGLGAAAAAGFALAGSAWFRPAHGATMPATPVSEWQEFRRRFVSEEGRVIDTGNGGISHSEGQGIAMLCAALFGTQAEFDLLHGWTKGNLRRAGDALHSWRYRPGVPDPVDDPNNATDGDLLIGYALFNAADRWSHPDYRLAGRAIARDVLGNLVRNIASGVVLLPGVQGFEKHDGIVLNPSYYMFPALRRFAAELPDPIWSDLWTDGLTLLRAARFGRWELPPDWISLSRDGGLSTASSWPARYSFDAVRLPLYMCWAGLQGEPAVLAADAFWSSHGAATPAWTDLASNSVAPYGLTTGMEAIRRYVSAAVALRVPTPDLPRVAQAADYYSGALIMLTHAASNSFEGVSA